MSVAGWICISPGLAKMAVAMPIAEVLLTQDAGQKRKIDLIDFQFEDMRITPQGLREVGRLMLQGRINIEVGDTGEHLGAAYSPHSNTMHIGATNRPPNDEWRAGIIHESVHALVDLRRVSTSVLNDETAAYLAEAIYIRSGGIAIVPSNPKAARILEEARLVVEAHQMQYRGGARLSVGDCRDLQSAILAYTEAYAGADTQQTSGLGID